MKKEISSGAEKAEKLAKKPSGTAKSSANRSAAHKGTEKNATKVETAKTPTSGSHSAKKSAGAAKSSKAEKDKGAKRVAARKAREEKKLRAQEIRAEKKQRRLEKKLEHKQKRLDKIAAVKEKKAERREKRRERRDMLKHETKEARMERRREESAAKRQARMEKRRAHMEDRQKRREHRLAKREQKRQSRREREHAPGFGGWLAAVISLGVTTLALGTMLTFGWLNMNGMEADMAGVHTQSLYELNAIVDNLDGNLSKARVASSASEQVRLLSDIAIESEMAETILERMPVDSTLTQNMSDFVNKMGDSAQSMLYSVAAGNGLSDSQKATIEHMYETNMQLKRIINELASSSSEREMIAAMKGREDSLMYSSFTELSNNTVETPKEINDGPFAENIERVSAKSLEGLQEITSSEAEKLAREYFADYGITEARCTGETLAKQLECFNVTIKTDDGEMLVQLSKKGGRVVMFDSYKDCPDKNFSVDRCITIAEDFLASLGYEDMKAVWTSENGTTCNLNFVYESDGVIFYPDMVKVKVCEQRGIVTGMEGLAYALNHTERSAGNASISESEAESSINASVEVKDSRLCVMPIDGGEVLAYEFTGMYKGSEYYIYVDATTGEEIQVLTVIGTKQGRALL